MVILFIVISILGSGANRGGGAGGRAPPRKKFKGGKLMVQVLPHPLDKK